MQKLRGGGKTWVIPDSLTRDFNREKSEQADIPTVSVVFYNTWSRRCKALKRFGILRFAHSFE